MSKELLYILGGYLTGGILFARIFGRLLAHKDITEAAADGNPGTANAFLQGGLLCGSLTLLCELAKGFLPVFFYFRSVSAAGHVWPALVLAAPVLGHAFPIMYRFHGGKGIAVSFGCLLGMFPYLYPVCVLVCTFIFFSVILNISPHYHRTAFAYAAAMLILLLRVRYGAVLLGFSIITATVCLKLLLSAEEREKLQIHLLWHH